MQWTSGVPSAAADVTSGSTAVLLLDPAVSVQEADQFFSNGTGMLWTSGVPAAAPAADVGPECPHTVTSLWQVVQDHKQQQQMVDSSIATVSQEAPAAAAAVGAGREAFGGSQLPLGVREALVPVSVLTALVIQVRGRNVRGGAACARMGRVWISQGRGIVCLVGQNAFCSYRPSTHHLIMKETYKVLAACDVTQATPYWTSKRGRRHHARQQPLAQSC
jgi:hypothetical protein